MIAVLLITVFLVAAYLTFFQPTACASPQGPASGEVFTFKFSDGTAARSPDNQTSYDNLTLEITRSNTGCGGAGPGEVGTDQFTLSMYNFLGISITNGTARCASPDNFTSCDGVNSSWYAVLFTEKPGVQSSFPSVARDDTWTSNYAITEYTFDQKISIVSSYPVANTGLLLRVGGTLGFDAQGQTTL